MTNKSAGQTLKEFDKMMEELKPYLPPPTIILHPKPQPYRIDDGTLPLPNKRSIFEY